jgi:4-hydroxy-tetrahydrodipicolinate synthase
MARRGEQFAGLTVALVTPLKDGQIDEDALRKLVDFQVEAGTESVSPVGTTGESPTLTHEEHERVISIVCEQAAGRVNVMAGTGSNSTAEAIRLTKFAKSAGADAALLVAPYYNKPTQEGFFQHYKAVSEAVDIPIVLYNIPGRTAKNVEAETVARIAEACPNVVAVKESTGSMDQASQTLSLSDLTVLSGDDSLTLPLLALGGSGVVSVVGNIVPQSSGTSSQAVPALSRPAGHRDESDSDQRSHGRAGPRYGRSSPSDDSVGCKSASSTAGNSQNVRFALAAC